MKRITALILALVMVLLCTGCGEGIANNTVRPINDIVLSKTGKEGSVDSTAPFPGDKFINPLSGELTDVDLTGKRPIGFMNNNIYQGTPQHGISNAEIVFEMNAEGNVTRFLTVYQNITSETPRIGSIRSARPYYLDWVLAFDMILVRAGGSATANKSIINRKVTNINALAVGAPTFYRDQERLKAGYAIEHTLFTSGKLITKWLADHPGTRQTHEKGYQCSLKFSNIAQTDGGKDAQKVAVKMNSTKRTLFQYDAESKKYFMREYDKDMTDGNTKEKLSVKNVLVLFVKYRKEYTGSKTLLADMSGGKGKYACEGKIIDITWTRTDAGGLKLKKADGKELILAVGHSFVCCADASSGSVALTW